MTGQNHLSNYSQCSGQDFSGGIFDVFMGTPILDTTCFTCQTAGGAAEGKPFCNHLTHGISSGMILTGTIQQLDVICLP